MLTKMKDLKEKKKYMDLMGFIAECNGGELISKEYTKYKDKYEFNLKKGDDRY